MLNRMRIQYQRQQSRFPGHGSLLSLHVMVGAQEPAVRLTFSIRADYDLLSRPTDLGSLSSACQD